jgi:small subunit ribosomal protein S16
MKRLGRVNRPFFRVCAIDRKRGRDGRVIEELGYYDPLVGEVDARAILKAERIAYWLSVGAQPSERVKVLIKKYGQNGTHAAAQLQALERQKLDKPKAPPPRKVVLPVPAAPEAAAGEAAADAPAESGGE